MSSLNPTRGAPWAARGPGLVCPCPARWRWQEAMGGRLDGVSEGEGLGATFTVSLSAAIGEGREFDARVTG